MIGLGCLVFCMGQHAVAQEAGDDNSDASPIEVAEGLGVQQVNEAIAPHFEAIRKCYQTQLEEQPDLEGGSLVLRFQVKADGTVGEAEAADNSLKNEAVARCVLDLISRVQFPEPDDDHAPVAVGYPLRFANAALEDLQ